MLPIIDYNYEYNRLAEVFFAIEMVEYHHD